MSFQYAVLGLINQKPLTGYDLKKIIKDSSFMYWSANNNQIYKTLVSLHEDGMVTTKVEHPENGPSKKIYYITDSGREALLNWIISTEPELPEIKKNFLIQLAWAGDISKEELMGLLQKYEDALKLQLIMEQEKRRRQVDYPEGERERYLWQMISENIISSYENEIRWVLELRKGVQETF